MRRPLERRSMVFGLLRQRSPGGSSQDDSENTDTSELDKKIEMGRTSQQTLENKPVEQTLRDDSVEGLTTGEANALADEITDLPSSSSKGEPNQPDIMENGPPQEPLTNFIERDRSMGRESDLSAMTTPEMIMDPHIDMDVNVNMALVHKSLELLLDNKFLEAEDILKKHYETDMHFALGYGAMLTFQAIMTYDSREIEKGYAILAKGLELTDSQRQKRTDYLRMKAPKYEEVVAELLYAETLLLTSLLSFTQSDSVIAMIKGAVKGRTSYGIYRDLYNKYILKAGISRHNKSKIPEYLSNDFLSGILMGYGCFHIALSMVPPKLLKILELVGLQGDTQEGLKALSQGVDCDGLRSSFCAQAIIAYESAFKFHLDPYNMKLEVVDKLTTKYLAKHPVCVSFQFFAGRTEMLRRNLPSARQTFEKCIMLQDEWVTMHHTCWFELLWVSSLEQKWSEAAEYAERLFGASNWSKTSYLYLLAAFRHAQFIDSDPSRKYAKDPNITTLFKDVKEYQIRVAGKRLQIEKYCVRKARSFKNRNNFLFLPALEAMYIWGIFSLLDESTAKTFIQKCDSKMVNGVTDVQLCADDRALGHLMIGVLWKHCYLLTKNNNDESSRESCLQKSEDSLTKSLSYEKQIALDHFIMGWANYEMAELYWLKGDNRKAMESVKACKKVSSKVKYSLESRVMFKIHNLTERIKNSTGNTSTT
ncbi:tetratricopeptide repeat protein 39B-like [Bolinopsis microptera]|uniref:tetratricopeptide repeat protein 39B-like n=1 Tax=Bolinopsis microptera TaxID=2820187 RepID=UPI00307AFA0A